MNYLIKAIKSLYPNAEWTLQGDSLDGLYFIDPTIKKPTQAQVDGEIAKIQAAEATAEADKAAAKAALLQRLGITAEEAALLMP